MFENLGIPLLLCVKYPSIDETFAQYGFLREWLPPYNMYGYGLKAAPVFSRSGNFIILVARFVCPPEELCTQIKSFLLSQEAREEFPPESETLIILDQLLT